MIRMIKAKEKTNSYRPKFWGWSENPFPAFRGEGQRHTAFQAVANSFKPEFFETKSGMISDDYCKLIKTKKGTNLIVPCSEKEDEKILLITATSAFRAGFSRVEAINAEILFEKKSSLHCVTVIHIVARVKKDGFIMTETGDENRSTHGLVEVYSWEKGLVSYPTEEYEAATKNQIVGNGNIVDDLERIKESEQNGKVMIPEIKSLAKKAKIPVIYKKKSFSYRGETYLYEKDRFDRFVASAKESISEMFRKRVEEDVKKALSKYPLLRGKYGTNWRNWTPIVKGVVYFNTPTGYFEVYNPETAKAVRHEFDEENYANVLAEFCQTLDSWNELYAKTVSFQSE